MGVSCGDRIIVRVTFRVRFRVGLCVRVRVRDRKLSLGTYYVMVKDKGGLRHRVKIKEW